MLAISPTVLAWFSQKPSMSKLIDRWAAAMKEEDWNFNMDKDKNLISFVTTTEVAQFRSLIIFKEEAQHVILLLCLERRCPEKYRKDMMEFCNRINWQSAIGNFACDPRDGEVRVRHSADVESLKLTGKFVDNFLKVVVGTAKRNYMKLQAIMEGIPLEDALELEY